MAVRPTVLEKVQIGVESTLGTGVAADKQLLCTSITPRPSSGIVRPFRPVGSKAPTTATRIKEMTEADIEGAIGYNDVVYLLASLLGAPSWGSGVATYMPAAFGADTPKGLTVEVGSAVRAEKFAYGLVTDLSFRFSQEDASLSGRMIGRNLQEGITMTPGPTELAEVPVDPDTVDILVGADVAGLAKITDCISAEFGISNRWGAHMPLDSAFDSYSDHIELAPELSASIVVEHDSVAAGYMADLRAKTLKVMRIKATGPEYTTGQNYEFQITFPFMFADNSRGDQGGMWGSTFNLIPMYDNTFGGWVEFKVKTGGSTL